MQYIWTIIHNNPPPPAYTVMSDVQEETGGVSDELCLLPVKLRPLTGTVGTELCLRRRRFSRVTPQRSMVSCPHQHAVIIIIFIHQDVFLVQILKKPHTVTVKSELKAMTGEQMLVECSAHNPPPQLLLRLHWMTYAGSLLAFSLSLLDQKEGSCVWSPRILPWEERRERPSF